MTASMEDNHFLLGSNEDLVEGWSDLETKVWVVFLFPVWNGCVDLLEDALSVHNDVLSNVEGELGWVGDFGDH